MEAQLVELGPHGQARVFGGSFVGAGVACVESFIPVRGVPQGEERGCCCKGLSRLGRSPSGSRAAAFGVVFGLVVVVLLGLVAFAEGGAVVAFGAGFGRIVVLCFAAFAGRGGCG